MAKTILNIIFLSFFPIFAFSQEQNCNAFVDFTEKMICKQAQKLNQKINNLAHLNGTCASCNCCGDSHLTVSVSNIPQFCVAECAILKNNFKNGCDNSYESGCQFGAGANFGRPCPDNLKTSSDECMYKDPGSAHECMDLTCLRSSFEKGGSNIGTALWKAERKEYRMLSDDQRQRFHAALWQMKQRSVYDYRFARIHSQFAFGGEEFVTGAHFGPAFLPWHREFIKRFEFELRRIDPSVSLPYWDTALDARLTNPADSVLFSDELMSAVNRNGEVTTGTLKGWTSIEWDEGRVEYVDQGKSRNIRRQLGQSRPMNDEQISSLLKQPLADYFLSSHGRLNARCPLNYKNRTIETYHAYTHGFMGGDMSDITLSANDPVFFMFHAFVDMVWEMWRFSNQNGLQKATLYPKMLNPNCASKEHEPNNIMQPFFEFNNSNGLSTKYTDNLYLYQPRPECSYEQQACGSRFLFCDFSHGNAKCVSKIRSGSHCQGYYYEEKVCYNSTCMNGRCVNTGRKFGEQNAPNDNNSLNVAVGAPNNV